MVQFTSNPFACGCQKCRQGDLLLPVLVEMHMDIAEVSVENLHAADQDRDPQFVRACAVKMHMDVSQEQFYARIYRKKAGEQRAYPDLTLA